jgi:hypothetical protein
MKVTGEQVREAAIKAGITRVDHHDCGGCGYMCTYRIVGGQIYFDPGCDCSRFGPSPMEPVEWESAARWINMQSQPKIRAEIAAKFGLVLEAPADTAT